MKDYKQAHISDPSDIFDQDDFNEDSVQDNDFQNDLINFDNDVHLDFDEPKSPQI